MRSPPLRVIIAYKLTRAAASLVLSALMAGVTAAGYTAPLHGVAEQLRRHATSAWSIGLADALVRAVVPWHLWLVIGALAMDGALSFLEGWSLHRSWWWAPWLVVVTTAAFLPIEVVAIARRADVGRCVLLVANVATALYLARRALGTRSSGEPR